MGAALKFLPAQKTQPLDVEALFRESANDLYAYLFTLLRQQQATEDATATTFELACKRRANFDARKGTPKQWLFGIGRNVAFDEISRIKRHSATNIGETLQSADAERFKERLQTDSSAGSSDLKLDLQAAILRLPQDDRELIALRYYGDLSGAEISKLTGLSQTNVTTKLARTLTKLREAMQ